MTKIIAKQNNLISNIKSGNRETQRLITQFNATLHALWVVCRVKNISLYKELSNYF